MRTTLSRLRRQGRRMSERWKGCLRQSATSAPGGWRAKHDLQPVKTYFEGPSGSVGPGDGGRPSPGSASSEYASITPPGTSLLPA